MLRFRKIRTFMNFKRQLRYIVTGENVSCSHKFTLKKSAMGTLTVGNNVALDGMFVIKGKGKISIGNFCSFRSNTYLGAKESITIGNNVFGAEGVYIVDNNNHPTEPELRFQMTLTPPNSPAWKWDSDAVISKSVVIEDNVWLGRNCMILKGVHIGEGSIVAAGAVVTKPVPAYSIVAGNPAVVVKSLKENV